MTMPLGSDDGPGDWPQDGDEGSRREDGARLLAAAAQARELDIRPCEQGAACSELVPRVIDAVESAMDVCRCLLATYDEPEVQTWSSEQPPESTGEFLRELDEAAVKAGPQVGDLAFMGVAALEPKRAALERLRSCEDKWLVVAECSSARRRILKALTALEAALAVEEGRRTRLTFGSELSRSLQTRQQYTKLRRTLVASDFAPERAKAQLRKAGTSIAIFIGKDIYPDLRISDRRQLRSIQVRIIDWLRADECAETARRLHEDLVMFARLIAQVRHRVELLEHDGAVLRKLLEEPETRRTQGMLRSLLGLHDDLDALLAQGQPERHAWMPIVRRALEQSGSSRP